MSLHPLVRPLPISIMALNSITLGTTTSAAEYDGWIAWGARRRG